MEKLKEVSGSALRWVLALSLAAVLWIAVGGWAVAKVTVLATALGLSAPLVGAVVGLVVALAALGAVLSGHVFDVAHATIDYVRAVFKA